MVFLTTISSSSIISITMVAITITIITTIATIILNTSIMCLNGLREVLVRVELAPQFAELDP